MTSRRRSALVCAFFVLAAGLSACERVDEETLERWRSTKKGPEKLAAALADSELEPNLRGIAAEQLVLLHDTAGVLDSLQAMPSATRQEVLATLVPRLWEKAKIAGEMDQPSPEQRDAKDALFELRSLAEGSRREEVDGYLIEWLTGGYYEGRARSGRISGHVIIAAIGKRAGPSLVRAARSIITRPMEGGSRPRVGDNLLLGLGASGDPEAVKMVLALIEKPQGDDGLPRRAADALYDTYIEPQGFNKAPAAALEPNLEKLASLAVDANQPGRVNNIASDLILAVGPPGCEKPFLDMIAYPEADSTRARSLRWVGVQKGVRCGGADLLPGILKALPPGEKYERAVLDKYLWREIRALPSRKRAAEAARELLKSQNWVARITGIELLGELRLPGDAEADAERIQALASDQQVLKGWWKDRPEGEGGPKTPNPTLGQVASDVAKRLREVAAARGNK